MISLCDNDVESQRQKISRGRHGAKLLPLTSPLSNYSIPRSRGVFWEKSLKKFFILLRIVSTTNFPWDFRLGDRVWAWANDNFFRRNCWTSTAVPAGPHRTAAVLWSFSLCPARDIYSSRDCGWLAIRGRGSTPDCLARHGSSRGRFLS